VTRGASPRNHSFPDPPVNPTIYAFARETAQLTPDAGAGVSVLLAPDIRWSRCDIKSVALLANTLSFQKAHEKGHSECIFVRDGFITEGSRSNIFFVKDGCLHTHPESGNILSGVTRKNVLRFARQKGIPVREEPIHEKDLNLIAEAFITNTSAEVKPVTSIGSTTVGDGKPGPVTLKLREMFRLELEALKG
jgi:D-alanine transaminase